LLVSDKVVNGKGKRVRSMGVLWKTGRGLFTIVDLQEEKAMKRGEGLEGIYTSATYRYKHS
jgi:hypothetical protein